MRKVKIIKSSDDDGHNGYKKLEEKINKFLTEAVNNRKEIIAIDHCRSDDENNAYYSALIYHEEL